MELNQSLTFVDLMQSLQYFVFIAGFVIGLGAVTVIDLHGFLAQRSTYWTRATIQSHKITKPLIWIGTLFLLIGEFLLYTTGSISPYMNIFSVLLIPMIFNGIFLSFYVSPILIEREKQGKAEEILPRSLQNQIFISFIISFISWWSCVILFTLHISS